MAAIRTIQFVFLLSIVSSSLCTVTFVKEFLQYNLFGIPVLHKTTHWDFDPDEAVRRSRQYQELNGRFGELAIERLGLGVDGLDQERLAQQRIRDAHLLGHQK